MDSQTTAVRSEIRARLHAVRDELVVQRERLLQLIEACQATTLELRQNPDELSGPRLFARDVVRIGEAEVLIARQAIRHAGGVHRVTPTEWQLLTFLLANPGAVHSRLQLAVGAWGPGFAERNSEVEVYVSRLRRKLGSAGRLLETVRGRGYRLVLASHPRVALAAQVLAGGNGNGGNGVAVHPVPDLDVDPELPDN